MISRQIIVKECEIECEIRRGWGLWRDGTCGCKNCTESLCRLAGVSYNLYKNTKEAGTPGRPGVCLEWCEKW